MKITEVVAALKLYHGTRANLPVGTILRPQAKGYATDDDEMVQQAERIFERYRPRNCIPRSKAVFMVADPSQVDRAGGYEDFIYQVEPIGKVERSDLGWYGEIAAYYWDDENDPEARQCAESYWAGIPFEPRSLFEYRSRTARIVALYSQS